METTANINVPNVPCVASAVAASGIRSVLNRVNLKSFLEAQLGKFVALDFIKNDGTRRMLNGRLGVVSYLHGGANNVERPARPYLTVFDAQKRAYRTVRLDTVSALRASGQEFAVVD